MGATRQLQKTRTADIITKTAITQKQSLEVVQTLLHGGLSSLAYLRNFFSEKAFDQLIYSIGDGIPSYKDFAEGKLAREASATARKPNTTMRILRRNRSRRVDMFLDWLEKGAFVALRDGTLRGVQIYVHADAIDRAQVIEAYTFTVKCCPDPETGNSTASIELGSPNNDPVTVEATNSGMQMLLRAIISLCNTLPDLPEKRYVSMALFCVTRDGQSYQPDGFVPSTTDKLLFAHADGWEKRTQSLEMLQSAFHNTSIKITHLQQPSLLGISDVVGSRIPPQMDYRVVCSRIEELGLSPSNAGAPTIPENTSTEVPSNVTPLTAVEAETSGPSKTDAAAGVSRSISPQPQQDDIATNGVQVSLRKQTSVVPDSLDTQSSTVPRMKRALLGMMRPERLTQGDTQTQALMHPPPPPEKEQRETRQDCTISPPTEASADRKLSLLPDVAAQLDAQKSISQQTAMRKAAKARSKTNDVVLCQCGHEKEEEDMVNCSYCDTWQHVHCYGFTAARDPRMPDDHACYQCLLGGRNNGLLVYMREMTLKRRAMAHALKHGLKSKNDLAKVLGVSVDKADKILKYLRDRKFISAAAMSHQAGFAATGKPHFVPIKGGSAYEQMLQDLFDPILHIEAYYTKTSNGSTRAGEQPLSLVSMEMPPPATPRSHMRTQATPTTASGLDLRASMTPYKTPIRGHATHKRGRPDDDVFTTPAKRAARETPIFKRLQSVQTQSVLSIDGLSSSPGLR